MAWMFHDLKEPKERHIRGVMGSSKEHKWATPDAWYEYLDLEFGFDLDPCCSVETARCQTFFTPLENGLVQSWKERRVFMNPPFDAIALWMEKAYRECRENQALVVCLIPARVDTQWWHAYASQGEIRFPKGRLIFKGATENAPFACAIVIFRPRLP